MNPPTIACAQSIRDGGIDAMAALNDALSRAVVGLESHEQNDLKRVSARVMAEEVTEIINPVIAAYPELSPDDETWASIAKTRAAERSSGAQPQP